MATHEMTEIKPTRPKLESNEDSRYLLQQEMMLEIQIEAEDLHSTDIRKGDPFCVVKEVREGMLGSVVIGKTEIINGTLTPVFVTPIHVPYLFEEDQILQFSIYDFDLVGGNDLIGEITIRAVELVKEQKMERILRKKQRNTGTIKLHIDIIPPLPPQNFSLKFTTALPAKFWKPNVYLIVEKLRCDSKTVRVHKSDTMKYKTGLVWNVENIKRELLHTNDDSHLIFSVYSTSKFSQDKLLGSTEVTSDQLSSEEEFVSSLNEKVIVRSPSKLGHDPEGMSPLGPSTQIRLEKRGEVGITAYKLKSEKPDYFNFIKENGLKLKIHVAIDFTASNGHYKEMDSLHTLTASGNSYIEVLQGALPQMLDKVAEKNIAAYGFGAKLEGETETSHCFQLDPKSLDVDGLDTLLTAYTTRLREVTLSGPTVFSKVVKRVVQEVRAGRENEPKQYNILIIITDGVICDREATIDAIVYASYLPMSIVVVGIGKADFTDMRRLDGDLQPLKNGKNQQMIRDIVQFVTLDSVDKNRELVKKYEKEEHFLTKAIYREVPEQIIEYYEKLEPKIDKLLKGTYKEIQWWSL